MRRKYKYNIGEKVSYMKTICKEKQCAHCGHIEEVYSYVKATGKVKSRLYNYLYNVTNGFVDTASVEAQKDGRVLCTPYTDMSETQVKVACYLIGDCWLAEESLTK